MQIYLHWYSDMFRGMFRYHSTQSRESNFRGESATDSWKFGSLPCGNEERKGTMRIPWGKVPRIPGKLVHFPEQRTKMAGKCTKNGKAVHIFG